MKLRRNVILGSLLIFLSLAAVGVSAYVYEAAQQSLNQTVKEIATITLKNSDLGNIEEGQTLTKTKADVPNLGAATNFTTTKAHVYMYLTSDLDGQTAYYSTFNIVVKYATVPVGSAHNVGDTAVTLSLASPNSGSVDLDASGSWTFDFEITTTAESVSTDHATTVTITVMAQSS